MLIAKQLRNACRVHPFQAFDARDIVAVQDTVDQQRRLVVAQGTLEHGAHIVTGVRHHQALRLGDGRKPVDHIVHPLARHGLGLGNGLTKLLHLFGRQVFKDRRRLFLAERHHQNGGVLQPVRWIQHVLITLEDQAAGSPLIQVFMMLATAAGLSSVSLRALVRANSLVVGTGT